MAEESRAEQLRKQLAKSRALKASGTVFEVADDPLSKGQKVVVARQGGKVVGEMTLYSPSDKTNFKGAREIRQVWTDPNAQRQGVASSLYTEAKKLGLKPVHSSQLTEDGSQFAKSVGGPKAPLRPFQQMAEKAQAVEKRDTKKVTKQSGQQRAVEIAKLRASGKGAEVATPEARRSVTIPRGMPAFGNTLGVIGLLPTLAEGGRIFSGRMTKAERDRYRG
jgi:hypothetical protein